jgi:hypothetical protein
MHRNIAIILIAVAVTILFLKSYFEWDAAADGDQAWKVSISVAFKPLSPKSQVYLQVPYETEYIREAHQRISKKGLSLTNVKKFNRPIVSAAPVGSEVASIVVESQLILSQAARFFKAASQEMNEKILEATLKKSEFHTANEALIETLRDYLKLGDIDRNEAPEVIFDFVSSTPLSRINTIFLARLNPQKSEKIKSEIMAALSRNLFIPARVVEGFNLVDQEAMASTVWVEIYIDSEWQPYHPGRGFSSAMPHTYIAFDKSGQGIVSFKESEPLSINIGFDRISDPVMTSSNPEDWTRVFNLNRLSIEVRNELAILMLLPLGALCTVLIRQFAGVLSYGVFTPTMLALAITYTDSMTTMVILLITIIGIFLARPTFDSSMNRTARLPIIFTFVAICMVAGVSILDFTELSIEGHLVLLPVVILTSAIDRFFSLAEQKTYISAIIRMLWTIVISLLISVLFQWKWAGYYLLDHPEIHLITVGLILMIKDYSGKTFLQLKQFEALTEHYWESRLTNKQA